MLTKIIIPCIIILVIFFYLKKKEEPFENVGTMELGFSPMNSIFMISSDIKFVEQSVEGTTIYKTNNLVYSNKSIFSESGEFTGFIFNIKPNQRIKIGFSNLEQDPNDEIAHAFEILDNGVFQIVERVQDSKEYLPQDIDFCLSGDTEACLRVKNKYTFNPLTDMLAIVINQGKANYLIVKRNSDGLYGAMLIHKSKNPLKFPYRVKAKSIDQMSLLPTLLWTKHNYVYDSPVYWSVETQFKDVYENTPIERVPMETNLEAPIFTPAPTIEDEEELDFAKIFSSGVKKILITDVGVDDDFYELDFRHNLDQLFLRVNNDRIFLKLYLDDNTYIFRKFEDTDSIKIFRNQQQVVAIEIVIGDVVSNKYLISEENAREIERPIIPSPSTN